MITEEMLCAAAARSCEIYVSYLERGYNPENQHEFSLQFKKKIKKLKRKADHPVFYHAARRIASIVLAILIAGGVWITVDAEARAAFVGWVKEVYEEFFVYRFNDETDIQNEPYEYEFTWLPNGYVKLYEKDTGSRITRLYKNEAGQMLQFNCVYDPNETDIYVVTKEHKVTEYNYSEDGTCVASTNVYRSPETQYNLASNTSLTYAGQIKYSTPKDHLGTISTFYMDCSYRKEVDPVAQYNVAKQSQNKAAYASFLASLISLPLGFAHPLAGAIMALFGLGASAVGFAIPDYMLHAKKTTMHWKIKDTRAADRTYFTTDCEYIITDEEQLNEKYSDVHYYTYTDFVNKNKSMASHFQQLIYRGLYLEPVQWTIG